MFRKAFLSFMFFAALHAVGGSIASAAPTSTFTSCAGASGYGYNSARLYVSQAMNRAACDPAQVQRAEGALESVFKAVAIPSSNRDELQVCFYQGLYWGYIEALDDELGQCDAELALESVAGAAAAVFVAASAALPALDAGVVREIFACAFRPGYNDDRSACEERIRERVARQLGLVSVDHLVETVCWDE